MLCGAEAKQPMPITIPELLSGAIPTSGVTLDISGTLKLTRTGLMLDSSEGDDAGGGIRLEPSKLNSDPDYKVLEGKKVRVIGACVINKSEDANAKIMIVFDTISVSPRLVSLLNLIVLPDKFNDMMITVGGYYKPSHRGPMLYLSKDDADNFVTQNMILLQQNASDGKIDDSLFAGKYVNVTGRFSAYKQEQVVMSQGYITFDTITLTK